MSNLALELRPQSLDTIIGQDAAKKAIKSFAEKDNWPNVFLFYGPPGTGKCFGKDTQVLMFDGTVKPVQEVKTGDQLMGPDSGPRCVLSTVSGQDEMYKISPQKGEPHVVNSAHILVLKGGNRSQKYFPEKDGTDISLSRYLDLPKTARHHSYLFKVPVEFSEQEDPLPVDPYFLGLWLGDGHSDGVRITTQDREIISFLEEYASSLGLRVHKTQAPNRCASYGIVGEPGQGRSLSAKLQKLKVINNKNIPHSYLVSSREDRLRLLAGILDSDGELTEKCFCFCNKNKLLVDQVKFVALSLGFRVTGRPVKKKCCNNGKVGQYYSLMISGHTDSVPVLLPRKKALPRLQKKDSSKYCFSVESLGRGEYFGFTITGDGRFLLGDFTVTHNTTFAEIVAKLIAGEDGNIHQINGSVQNKVEDARELSEIAQSCPFNGRRRVFIVNEFQKWTDSAQEAVKDTMEKCPAVWLITTDQPDKISKAILSRASAATFQLKTLGRRDLRDLVGGVLTSAKMSGKLTEIADFLEKHKITAPREILGVLDQYLAGVPLEECVHGSEHEPLYKDVAGAVLNGNWTKAAAALAQIKTADARGLVGITSTFFRNELVKCPVGPRARALAQCLKAMDSLGFADGSAYGAVVGIFYLCCETLTKEAK